MMIIECREQDIPLLDRCFPAPGVTSSHPERFARQRSGLGTLLVAWREDGWPVGRCEVRWDGCAAPEVRAVHGDCPEVNGLGVWPESQRSQGIGTALLHAAEELAERRGTGRIGLGAMENDPRATALYERLGYRPTVPYLDCWVYEDAGGTVHHVADPCTFMVKELRGAV